MSIKTNSNWSRWLVSVAMVALFASSVGRIHLRVQTTLIGYELGDLKANEAEALEEQSVLKMQLAKLTTRQHLKLMAGTDDDMNGDSSFAAK